MEFAYVKFICSFWIWFGVSFVFSVEFMKNVSM